MVGLDSLSQPLRVDGIGSRAVPVIQDRERDLGHLSDLFLDRHLVEEVPDVRLYRFVRLRRCSRTARGSQGRAR